MGLKNLCAKLSDDGSLLRLEDKSGATLETLRLVKATDDHRSFILSTWVRSYESQARRQGLGQFYSKYEAVIAESRWDDCWVLTDADGFTVHGWVCGSNGQLWHCYVVPELRRVRIATRLIEHACGELKEYARPWPYGAHARVNGYLLRAK